MHFLVCFYGLTELAFLIIERYEDLGRAFDESGVSSLHLLANQPTAFRSGARLNLIDGIMYHSKSPRLPKPKLNPIQPIYIYIYIYIYSNNKVNIFRTLSPPTKRPYSRRKVPSYIFTSIRSCVADVC